MSTELNTTQNADQIAYEINFIKQQTLETVLAASIQIGERLCSAKELVPHGQWSDWLKEKVDYSQSTADNLMRIYKEYGDEQITLSGRSKSQTFANLTYSQAVALFALPEHEREKFVETNDVSAMTTKELKQAIADKKAAEQEAERLRNELQTAQESAEKRSEKLKKQAEQTKSENDTLVSANESLKSANETLSSENDKLKSELEAANKKMKEIVSQPAELSEDEKEEIRRQVEEKYSGRIEQLTLDAETARQQAEQIAAEKAELERKAAQMANSDVIKIQALFEQVQNQFKSIRSLMVTLPYDKSTRMTELILNTAAQILGK